MRGVIAIVAVCLLEVAAATTAQDAPACKRAEINPVTGYTFCIDPLGAPVEAAPDIWLPECKDEAVKGDAGAAGTWTYGPSCKKEPAPG